MVMTATSSPLTSPSSSLHSPRHNKRTADDGKSMSTEQADRQRHERDSSRGEGGAALDSKHSSTPEVSVIADSSISEKTQISPSVTVSSSAPNMSDAGSTSAGMVANQFQQSGINSSSSSTSAQDLGASATSLQAFAHSAPATVTSFGAQQPPTAPHYGGQQGVPHEYSTYSQYHPAQASQQQSPSPFGQQLSPPAMYGPGETYAASNDGRLSHSFNSASASPVASSFGGPQHYYHSSVPTQLDDLRHSHHGMSSASGYSRQAAGHQPYYVPSQPQRAPVYTASIGGAASAMHHFSGSSIITANPDSLPDLRYSDGMSPAAAAAAAGGIYPPINYGRLPNGKIIELYPAMMRTIQACEYCRSRKAKCSGGLPCERCKKKNMKCEYAQLDKKRKVKTTTSEVDMSTGLSASSSASVKLGMASPGANAAADASAVEAATASATPALTTGVKTRSAVSQELRGTAAMFGGGGSSDGFALMSSLREDEDSIARQDLGRFSLSRRGTLSQFAWPAESSTPLMATSLQSFNYLAPPDAHCESDSGSEAASVQPMRLSPSTSDDSLTLTPAHEHVLPDALWSDATFVAPPASPTQHARASDERLDSYYDETIQRPDWYLYN